MNILKRIYKHFLINLSDRHSRIHWCELHRPKGIPYPKGYSADNPPDYLDEQCIMYTYGHKVEGGLRANIGWDNKVRMTYPKAQKLIEKLSVLTLKEKSDVANKRPLSKTALAKLDKVNKKYAV